MRDEWRPVVGFIGYEVTETERVRHKYYGELTSSDGTVALRRGNQRFHRSIARLAKEAFRDRQQPVLVAEGFRAIPSAPGYSISRKGEVFNERFGMMLRENFRTESVILVIDGKQVKRRIRALLKETYGT